MNCAKPGYTGDDAAKKSPLGTYSEDGQNITIRPGPQSYHAEDSATIQRERRQSAVHHRRSWAGAGQL